MSDFSNPQLRNLQASTKTPRDCTDEQNAYDDAVRKYENAMKEWHAMGDTIERSRTVQNVAHAAHRGCMFIPVTGACIMTKKAADEADQWVRDVDAAERAARNAAFSAGFKMENAWKALTECLGEAAKKRPTRKRRVPVRRAGRRPGVSLKRVATAAQRAQKKTAKAMRPVIRSLSSLLR